MNKERIAGIIERTFVNKFGEDRLKDKKET
jgi:hypothetical protein